jgi:RNA-splicing ligase RtcB
MHNYIDFANKIIHKGSIQALNKNKVVIPFNMRDGLAICEGLSNEDWLNSAPHGCGRKLSRNKAKQLLDVDEFKNQMAGIVSTSVSRSTIDEAPDAYKAKDEIVDIIKDVTVDIIEFIKPVINCKSYTSEDNG